MWLTQSSTLYRLAPFEHALVTLRAQLGEAPFAALWAEGRAMTLEQAVAYVLDERGDVKEQSQADGGDEGRSGDSPPVPGAGAAPYP